MREEEDHKEVKARSPVQESCKNLPRTEGACRTLSDHNGRRSEVTASPHGSGAEGHMETIFVSELRNDLATRTGAW